MGIEVAGGELAINGEVKEKERTGPLRSQTRRSGRFEYRLTLPQDVNSDAVTADLSEGVLTVSVPESEAARPRRIEITGG